MVGLTIYPLTDEWAIQWWPIHTMEYYSAVRRNGALLNAEAWMNLEGLMLRGKSRGQTATRLCILLL